MDYYFNKSEKKRLKILPLLILLIFSIINFPLQSLSQNLPIQFDQAQNGKSPSFNINWTNGILNATHTTYYEGVSTPQRLFLWNLDQTNDGTANHHTVKIRHLAEASGKHAYDFITSWAQAVAEAQNIGGVANEFGTAGANLYNAQLSEAPSEFTGTNAVFFNHAAFNGANPNYASDSYMPATFGDPTGTVPSVDNVLTCWQGVYGAPTFEIAGNAAISNFTVVAEPGYDGGNYKNYTLSWSSASDRVLILFAGHPAVGQTSASPICGYGLGQGAGSVNGGDYHIKLDFRDVSIGERDNQVMSSTFQIPPTCGLTGPLVACAETPSLTFNYQGTNAANASLVFTFTSNTANATFASNGTALNTLNATANSSGAYTLTVYPQTGGFTPGGDFQVRVTATTSGGSCFQDASLTHIEAVSVTASADPTSVNRNQANAHSNLTAAGTVDGNQDNTLFSSFTWSAVLDPGFEDGTAGLSSTSGDAVTFTPTTDGSYKFRVTAVSTEGCSATNTVIVNVTSGGSCPQRHGPQTVCEGATNLEFSADGPIPEFTHWDWSIASGDATITSADVSDVLSVNVNAGTSDFVVRITVSFDNKDIASFTCDYPVTVNNISPGTISGGQDICANASAAQLTGTAATGDGIIHYTWYSTTSSSGCDATDFTAIPNSDVQNLSPGSVSVNTYYKRKATSTLNGLVCEAWSNCISVLVHACEGNCSYTQGYYGGKGKSCDLGVTYNSPVDMLTHLLSSGQIVVGLTGAGKRSVTIGTDQASKLASVMPGSTTPRRLTVDGNCNIQDACFANNYVFTSGSSKSKINNVLLSQTITLSLNVRLKGGSLSSFVLPTGTFTTYALTSCSSDATIVPYSGQTFTIPSSVTTYLGNGATVANLLALANSTLSDGPATGAPSYSDVNNAVDAINRGFDQCRTASIPILLTRQAPRADALTDVTHLSVNAYPNPFNDAVKFSIDSKVSGQAQLDIYNILGQKVSNAYNGYIQANRTQVIDYKVPASFQKNLIYILRIGDEQVTGKLIKADK
jgi:hypothetical protein